MCLDGGSLTEESQGSIWAHRPTIRVTGAVTWSLVDRVGLEPRTTGSRVTVMIAARGIAKLPVTWRCYEW